MGAQLLKQQQRNIMRYIDNKLDELVINVSKRRNSESVPGPHSGPDNQTQSDADDLCPPSTRPGIAEGPNRADLVFEPETHTYVPPAQVVQTKVATTTNIHVPESDVCQTKSVKGSAPTESLPYFAGGSESNLETDRLCKKDLQDSYGAPHGSPPEKGAKFGSGIARDECVGVRSGANLLSPDQPWKYCAIP